MSVLAIPTLAGALVPRAGGMKVLLLPTLAQASMEEAMPILTICGILIATLVGSLLLATWIRRRIKADDGDSTPVGGFTLGQLRQLHRSGQMTTEEFERARMAILASMGKLPASPAGPAAPSAGRKNTPPSTGDFQPPAQR